MALLHGYVWRALKVLPASVERWGFYLRESNRVKTQQNGGVGRAWWQYGQTREFRQAGLLESGRVPHTASTGLACFLGNAQQLRFYYFMEFSNGLLCSDLSMCHRTKLQIRLFWIKLLCKFVSTALLLHAYATILVSRYRVDSIVWAHERSLTYQLIPLRRYLKFVERADLQPSHFVTIATLK